MENAHTIIAKALDTLFLLPPTLQLARSGCIPYLLVKQSYSHTYNGYGERFQCTLCDKEIGGDRLESHVESDKHVANFGKHLKVELEQLSRTSRCFHAIRAAEDGSLLDRVDELNNPTWKNAIHAGLFRQLVASDTGNHDNLDLLQASIQDLKLYEHYERLAMLDLAVWKAVCLLNMPKGLDFYDANQWMKSGWKASKADQRASNAMTIVLKGVMPFLEVPPSDAAATGA